MQSNLRKLAFIALAAFVGLAVFAVPMAAAVYGETYDLSDDLEVVYVDVHDSVIFLLGDACKTNLVNDYTERFSTAWIVCVDYADWTEARANLYGFEKYWHVVYVTQDNQHPEAPRVKGEAFFRDGENYAYSINNPIAIAHELLHLTEKRLYTSDGRHDYQCDDGGIEKMLWKQERGVERCIGF